MIPLPEFLESQLIKYSQGLIFWRTQSNNENNTPDRAKECHKKIERFAILYDEFNLLIQDIT